MADRHVYGQVYNVTVQPNFGNELPAMKKQLRGDLSISFSCDPEVVDLLTELALAEIQRLQVHQTLHSLAGSHISTTARAHES